MNSKARASVWERIRRRHDNAPPFASTRAALFSYEMGRSGLYLPTLTLVFWAIGAALYGPASAYLADPANRDSWHSYMFFFITQVLPSLSLLLSALTWQFYMEWRPRPKKKLRGLDWMARVPVTKQERARARMQAAAVNLGIMLGGIAALNVLSFLLAEHSAAVGLLGGAWKHGETSLREMVMICLGPVLVTGLLAWIAMTSAWGVFALFYTAVLGFQSMIQPLVCKANGGNCGQSGMALFGYAAWFTLLYPTLLILSCLPTGVWRGLISRRAAWLSTAAWLLLALALYPSAQLPGPSWSAPWVNPTGLAIGCLCLSAWVVLGWVSIVFRMRGNEVWSVQRENPEQHARFKVPHSTSRQLGGVFMVVLAAAIWTWLRWPVEPAAKSTLRSQGLPADSIELDRWYATVPPEENLALKYQAAADTEFCQYKAWIKFLDAKAGTAATPERKALEDNVLVCGHPEVERTQPIPAEVWDSTQDYWNFVGLPVAEMLHEIARSGLWKSRYPVHLERGFSEEFLHHSPLRRLAGILVLEGWIAAAERRPEDAVNALSCVFPIANSLSDEPTGLSQLVRFAILGLAVQGLENVVNRSELSDPLLARMQECLTSAVPPLWQGPIINRALTGERAMSLDYAGEYYLLLAANDKAEPVEGVVPAISVGLPLINLLGSDAFERAIFANSFRLIQDASNEAARTGTPPDIMAALRWKENSFLAFRTPIVNALMPAFDRAFTSELRIRAQLDLARTALAVERFRLANGGLPERLEDVVPAFLDRLPTDPWNGGNPVSYRVRDNGEFVVYSFGKNKTDENGEEMKDWWAKGDITFTVAPPQVRQQPQVAGAL